MSIAAAFQVPRSKFAIPFYGHAYIGRPPRFRPPTSLCNGMSLLSLLGHLSAGNLLGFVFGALPCCRKETHTAVSHHTVPLVNIKMGGTWVFIRPNGAHGHM